MFGKTIFEHYLQTVFTKTVRILGTGFRPAIIHLAVNPFFLFSSSFLSFFVMLLSRMLACYFTRFC